MSNSIHQRLMDEAHHTWEKPEYKTMVVSNFLRVLNPLHRSALVAGNLNYQVENGGFNQWYGNGYHKGVEFLFHFLKQLNTETAKEVAGLVRSAVTRLKRTDDDDCDDLDDDYYKINSKFMEECESFFRVEFTNSVMAV